jgi:hypothetical protein
MILAVQTLGEMTPPAQEAVPLMEAAAGDLRYYQGGLDAIVIQDDAPLAAVDEAVRGMRAGS